MPIDECIKELDQDQEMLTKTIKLPSTPIMEDDGFKSMTPFVDDNLYECLALTPGHMSGPKKPSIELKELQKNLRYEFLDDELNRPVIVSATLNKDETN